jgi:adenylyltransferase/sulfurtransferase
MEFTVENRSSGHPKCAFKDVIVAGVGALGSEVVNKLGQLGCPSVYLADPDVVEPVNQSRSPLFQGATALGRKKVDHLLDHLAALFPETHWTGSAAEIADVEPGVFSKAQVIFSCVDSDLARTEIVALAARFGLPVCDAGLGGLSTRIGRVSWLPGGTAACFGCLLTTRRRTALLEFCETEVHSCATLDSIFPDGWTSTPATAALIADLQVDTASSSIRLRDAFSIGLDLDSVQPKQEIRHSRSAGCPLHEAADQTGLAFPICTLAECLDCAREFNPERRIAWVRRYGRCPQCSSRKLRIRRSRRTSGGDLAERVA